MKLAVYVDYRGNCERMGADIPTAEPMRSSNVNLFLDSQSEAERELQATPFANRFAMLCDRFGASWRLLHQP